LIWWSDATPARDQPIATLDVHIEHLQGFVARHDEVFLHLHLHIRAGEQMAQPLPVAEEFSGDRGEEQLDSGHSFVVAWGESSGG